LPATDLGAAYVPLEIPRGLARSLFAMIQIGYLVMYGVALLNADVLEQLSVRVAHRFPRSGFWDALGYLLGIPVLAGTAVRLYSLFGTVVDYADLGRKYRRLFPFAVVLDVLWALSPLLLADKLGSLVLACSAPLVYLAFAQRHLVYTAYSPRGGRTSGLRSESASS